MLEVMNDQVSEKFSGDFELEGDPWSCSRDGMSDIVILVYDIIN